MGQGKLMIRMIDIVFILLFGFIAVSQISRAEAIEPSKSTEADEATPDGAFIVIIGVRTNGTFSAEGGLKEFSRVSQLKYYLKAQQRKARLEGKKIGVRIRANHDAPVLKSLAVAKACKELGIAKGLDVVKVKG